MSRIKRYWKDEYKYKRILEILEDYWLTEEDEEEVTVTMHFKHADGREQEKEIWWRNPNIENQPNEIKGVTLDELFAEHDAIDAVEVVRCKDCIHRFVDGDGVLFNCCELNHNKVQSDDWFCADGERKEKDDLDWEEPADLEMGYDPYLGCYTDDC